MKDLAKSDRAALGARVERETKGAAATGMLFGITLNIRTEVQFLR